MNPDMPVDPFEGDENIDELIARMSADQGDDVSDDVSDEMPPELAMLLGALGMGPQPSADAMVNDILASEVDRYLDTFGDEFTYAGHDVNAMRDALLNIDADSPPSDDPLLDVLHDTLLLGGIVSRGLGGPQQALDGLGSIIHTIARAYGHDC